MNDPYAILGVRPEDTDAVIRARYLELVKQFPPERDAARFAEIRAAYDKIKNAATRIQQRLFDPAHRDTLDHIIEEVQCRTPRRRFSLSQLVTMSREIPS